MSLCVLEVSGTNETSHLYSYMVIGLDQKRSVLESILNGCYSPKLTTLNKSVTRNVMILR